MLTMRAWPLRHCRVSAGHLLTCRVFALVPLAAFALRAFTFDTAGLDWDELLYIVIAQRWMHGAVPRTVAVWDQHPMGLPALFAVLLVVYCLLAARILGVARALLPARRRCSSRPSQNIRRTPRSPPRLPLSALHEPQLTGSPPTRKSSITFSLPRRAPCPRDAPPGSRIAHRQANAAVLLFGYWTADQIRRASGGRIALLPGLGACVVRCRRHSARRRPAGGFAVLGGNSCRPWQQRCTSGWLGSFATHLEAESFRQHRVISVPGLDWDTALLRLRYGLLPIAALLLVPWHFAASLQRREPTRRFRVSSRFGSPSG